MTSILAFTAAPAVAVGDETTTLLQKLLIREDLRVGDVAHFTRGLPEQWLLPTAGTILGYLQADIKSQRRGRLYRRDLVLTTMLLSRILQDIETIPADPDTEI